VPDPHVTVTEEVRAAVAAELGCAADMVNPEAALWDLSGLDSMKLVRIVNSLEKTCQVTLDDEDVYELESLPDLIRLVERKLSGPGQEP
jgi:acyl carrier protein